MNESLPMFLGAEGAVLFAVVLLEQVGVPIPAAPWLLAAGALCTNGDASFAMMAALAVLACLTADYGWFLLGRCCGQRILHWLGRFGLLRKTSFDQMERAFRRQGMPVLVAAKFVPGLSVLAPPLAGAFGIHPCRFLISDLAGSVLYSVVYLALGALFSRQLGVVIRMVSHLGLGSLAVLALLLGIYFLIKNVPLRSAVLRPKSRANVQIQIQTP